MNRLSKDFSSCLKSVADIFDFKKKWPIFLLVIFSFYYFVPFALADYSRYAPTEAVTIGDFVYDDDYQPSQASCSTTVYNPSGVLAIDDQRLSSNATGWHYYTFTPASIEGVWSATLYCGATSTGDLIREDKSFVVAANRLTDKSLVGGGSIATENYVDSATATLKSAIDQNSTLISLLHNISASDVWNYVGRDLDRPTIVAASSSEAVWNTALNTLTNSGSVGKLIADNLDAKISTVSTSSLTAADVWSVANRTLTDYSTSTITQAIWGNANRTLTYYGNDITAADVWNVLASSLTVGNSIGKQLADNVDAQVSTIPNLVWSAGSRTLTDYATSSIVTAVWNNPTRSLTTFGSLVSDIWSDLTAPTRKLTSADLTGGGSLVSENFLSTEINNATGTLVSSINSASSSLGSGISQTRSQISGLNNISAADVWAATQRTLTDYATSSIVTAVWSNPVRSLTTFGSLIADIWSDLTAPNRNLTSATLTSGGDLASESSLSSGINSATSTILTSINSASSSLGSGISQTRSQISGLNNISAADVWAATQRTLTDYATSSIVSAVWNNPVRSLTTFGSLIADIWSDLTAPNRNLTDATLTGGGTLATASGLASTANSVTSSIITQVLQNRTLINSLNNISASDVWSYVGRDLDHPVTVTASTTAALWQVATNTLTNTGSIGKLFVDNLDAKISTRGTSMLTAADIWDAGNRTLTDYSTSSIALGVWTNAARTLTSGGGGGGLTAEDVWNTLTSTLTLAGSIGKQLNDNVDLAVSTRASLVSQQAGWTVQMSDASSIAAGKTYRAKVFVFNSDSVPTDPASVPLITVYDADRNVVASSVAMSKLSNGIYEYTYSIANNASAGLWEASAATEVTSGKTLQTSDYWTVEASPAQVIVNTITGTTVPDVSANVTITNEGLSGYEYHYEWCVVASASNVCGGNDDVYYGSAAKFINPGDNWNTTLTATVPQAGSYFFKLVVYFGTEHSSASRSFTLSAASNNNNPPPSSGGGGGGGGAATYPVQTPVTPTPPGNLTCNGADFNHDKKVNSIDFSILLAFWKTSPPFRNPCVDVNHDSLVNSTDFSILLYEWGSLKP